MNNTNNVGKEIKLYYFLLSIIEAGGGHLCPNKVFNTIKMKPMRAEKLVSAIIIVNGSSLCSLSIGLDFVRSILIQRIPILYEEFIIKLIEFKVFIYTLEYLISITIKHISIVQFDVWSLRGADTLSDEDGENLLEEIEKEIVINEEKYGSSKIGATEISELEREQQRMVIYDDPLSDHDFSIPTIDDFGLDSIDLTSNNADEVGCDIQYILEYTMKFLFKCFFQLYLVFRKPVLNLKNPAYFLMLFINLLEPLNCSADLDGIPLAYLVFYDYNERRKRGLDQSALKTCMAVIDLFTHKKNVS
uniref:Uncharacterized protein n=1 Tax=Heterorhabditis bacteriophora TaxID=37862 RepID=A0A1I7XH23_HETBA